VSRALFSLLGVGSLTFSFLLFPLLRLLPGNADTRRRRGRWVVHTLFGWFIFALRASGILRVELEDFPSPEVWKGKLLLANHPGYLDVVVLISLLQDPVCVVKEAVWKDCIIGGVVREAGYVPSGSPEDVLEAGGKALREGCTMIIFPEGTRTTLGQPLRFQRGAAHLALEAGASILPVTLSCEPPLLEKGRRWYHIPIQTCTYRVRAHAPIPATQAGSTDLPRPQAARQLTQRLENFFNKEVYGCDRNAS
jgi:1-acyl-sn-glycerol-3-phosphate acyltransferase